MYAITDTLGRYLYRTLLGARWRGSPFTWDLDGVVLCDLWGNEYDAQKVARRWPNCRVTLMVLVASS